MKVLKLIEKVTFVVATTLTVFALTLVSMLDEGMPVAGIILPYFVSGVGLAVVILLVGSVLHFTKHRPTALVGDALTVAVHAVIFGVTLAALIAKNSNADVSVILAFSGVIVYMVSNLVRFIIYIVNKVNNVDGQDDPEKDPAIQNVLKWKNLKEEGIITQEEYEAKRIKILHLEKKEQTK